MNYVYAEDNKQQDEWIVTQYGGDVLHADYVQAGHHGWQVPLEVYEAIQPKEMFIDASDEILGSVDYADKHGILVGWCQENQVSMHSFGESPYSIVLE